MGRIILLQSKASLFNYLHHHVQPRKLRILRRWDFYTGKADLSKEFEGAVGKDSFRIRENHKMMKRSSPVLVAKVNEIAHDKIEVRYNFLIDKESIAFGLLYTMVLSVILFMKDAQAIVFLIMIPAIIVIHLLGFWFSVLTCKKRYIDFIRGSEHK